MPEPLADPSSQSYQAQIELLARMFAQVEQRVNAGHLSLQESVRLLEQVSAISISTANLAEAYASMNRRQTDMLYDRLVQVMEVLTRLGRPPHIVPNRE